jgi:hypothetical protein
MVELQLKIKIPSFVAISKRWNFGFSRCKSFEIVVRKFNVSSATYDGKLEVRVDNHIFWLNLVQ